MARYFARTIAIVLSMIAIPTWATHADGSYQQSAYDRARYDYARVLDVQPVTETVQIPEDRQVCRNEAVQRRVAENRSPGPAIFGAIIGGVIGNQLSRGHGHDYHGGYRGYYRYGHRHSGRRAAGTLAGAAIGGMIGSSVQYSEAPARYYNETVRVCGAETSYHNEERVVAWDVTWKYRGEVYHSRMDEPPGERIKVRVSVIPE